MKYSEAKEFLKVGMKVKIIKYANEGEWEGVTVTIDHINECGARFLGPGRRGDSSGILNHSEEELEILTEADGVTPWKDPRGKEVPKFKVGDRVRIARWTAEIGTCEGFEGSVKKLIGTIGIVTDVEDTCIFLDDNKYYINFHPNWLDFAPSEEPKEEPYPFPVMVTTSNPLLDYNILTSGCSVSYTDDQPKKKGFIMSAVNFIKKQALKLMSPDEYELREAGLYDSTGELTSDGEELRDFYLAELVKEKMVAAAKQINEAKKEKK